MADTKLELSIALSENENTRAILDGRIAPDAINLHPTALHPSEMFWRQLKFAEFDVSEMSMSSLTIATSQEPTQWVALPVFTTREFFHLRILVRVAAGIEKPADLKGKRVGVPEYQQTAAIWGRGVLQHEFAVHARDIEFFMERTPETSHGGSTGFKAPDGVTVHQIPPTTNIGEMMVPRRARRDAALSHARQPRRPQPHRLVKDTRFRPLFDRAAEVQALFRQDRHLPDQPRHGDPPLDLRALPLGRAQHLQRLRASPWRGSACPRHSPAPAFRAGPDRRGCAHGRSRPTRWPMASRETARCSRRSRNTSTSRA